mgnify:CR=1 FL=1|jgi:hypothetical protein
MQYNQINPELMQLVADYVVEQGLPVRCRPLWIARDLADDHGEDHLDRLRTTQTLKTSVQLCLQALGYVSEGVGGDRVWIREDHLLRQGAPGALA